MSLDSLSDADTSPEVMLAYYRRLFPFASLYTWLNHAHPPSRLFTHREFAFTLQGDVYLRYNSFAGWEEMKKQVLALNPTRFEIGPVYSHRPRDRKTVPKGFVPLLRELVIDIDMTDYDELRTCCTGASLCTRCWAFLAAAIRVLDSAIRDQFGWERLLWVYSGRRGVHLWVSDAEAMALTDEQRRAVVGSLGVISGGKEQHKKVNVRQAGKSLPPGLQSALNPLANTFTELILEDQNCFGSPTGYEDLLHLIPDRNIADTLREDWEGDPERSSSEKWADLKSQIKQLKKDSARRAALVTALEDIILQYTYPRIDAEVTKHRNHLLKSPFCIHPKTGQVCVPIDPSHADEFNPEKVPTVVQLLRELDASPVPAAMPVDSETNGAASAPADSDQTSLKPYVDMLDRHAKTLMEETRRVKREKGQDITW